MKLGKRHVLGLVLLVSLGLNVLLGGMMIGHWASDGPRQWGRGGSSEFDRQAAREALSPASQKIVDENWTRHGAKLRDAFKAVREARQEIQRVLTADQLDRAALEAAQAALAARWDVARTEMAAGLTDLALALPPEERKLYFTAGAKHGHSRGPRVGEPDAPPPPPPPE